MDFLKKFTEATKIDTKETPAAAGGDDKPLSQAELLSSAQVVAEAAKATFQHEPTNVDTHKLAGAAADILDAGQHYGKLDNSGIGGYVEQAEGYLKQYESSDSPPPKSPEETKPKPNLPPEETEEKTTPPVEASEETEKKTAPPPEEEPEETEKKTSPSPAYETAPLSESPAGDAKPTEENKPPSEPAAEEESEGGVGDYVKIAGGLLNKQSEGGDSGSGYGDVFKAAGDFLKKN